MVPRMFAGLEEIDWESLSHAYGPAIDTPQLIRDLCSEDQETVSRASSDLAGSINHQGSVYTATVAAVPFLVEAALHATHGRAWTVWSIGHLADPHHSYDESLPAVRDALHAAGSGLLPLLDDPDGEVRAAAVYAIAQAGVGDAPAWRRRWPDEQDPAVRVALALAMGLTDAAAHVDVLSTAVFDNEPAVAQAALLALLRAGLPWPDGAVSAAIAVLEAAPELDYCWHAHREPPEEMILSSPPAVTRTLLDAMLTSDAAETRKSSLWLLGSLLRERRNARSEFLPLLAGVLSDPATRDATVDLLCGAGRGAGRYREELATIAARYPATAAQTGFTAEHRAVETLIKLRDPRWVEIVCAAARDGRPFSFGSQAAGAFSAEVLAVVIARLRALPPGLSVAADRAEATLLTSMLRNWGTAALPAAEHLRPLLPVLGAAAAHALAAAGARDTDLLPYLDQAAAAGDIRAALRSWQLTGDAATLTAELQPVLHAGGHNASNAMQIVLPAAPALAGTADQVRALIIDPDTFEQLRVNAARLLWAITGERELPLRVLLNNVDNRWLAAPALDLAASMQAREVTDTAWRQLSGDGLTGVAAARALRAFGVAPAELAHHVVKLIGGWHPASREAVELLLELGDGSVASSLRELAERDEPVITAGGEHDIVWADEHLADLLRGAADRLAAQSHR
jgi:hypothetical protein